MPFILNSKDWKKATGSTGKLFIHETSDPHKAAKQSYDARMDAHYLIGCHMSKAYAEQLEHEKDRKQKNREALMAIIDIIHFLARQNISFRGHRVGTDSDNRSNFLELVHFNAKYNPVSKNWIDSHPRNVSWLSPEIQNELLHLLRVEVVAKTVDDIRGSSFSVLCDEVSDRSNSELMSIVLRYVSKNSSIVRSVLVGLVKVQSTTGKNLCDVIVNELIHLGLSLDDVAAQCFDGASNMSGLVNRVQARMKELCARKPIFVHCWAHVLNLILQDVVKQVPFCARIFYLLQQIYVQIEGSPKRHGEYMID